MASSTQASLLSWGHIPLRRQPGRYPGVQGKDEDALAGTAAPRACSSLDRKEAGSRVCWKPWTVQGVDPQTAYKAAFLLGFVVNIR